MEGGQLVAAKNPSRGTGRATTAKNLNIVLCRNDFGCNNITAANIVLVADR